MFRQFKLNIIVIEQQNKCSYRKECEQMNKAQELIERIEKLTPEQFEQLITLYSQQYQEFVQVSQVEPPSFLPLAL